MKTFNKKTWLVSQFRRVSQKYPPIYHCLESAKETHYITAKNGNPVKRVTFTCNVCKQSGFKRKEVQVDHINPVIDVKNGFTNWDDFVNGLFCEADNLQVICESCHDVKSEKEREARKANK